MHTSYAGAAGMLLYINGGGGLTIESMVSENKIKHEKSMDVVDEETTLTSCFEELP